MINKSFKFTVVQKLKLIVKYLISMTSEPGQFWGYLAKDKDQMSKPEFMQNNVFLPYLGMMALALFVIAGLSGEGIFDLQHAMTYMVPRLVAYFVGPYIAMFLLKEALPLVFGVPAPNRDRLQLYVFYSTGFLMLVEIFVAMVPSIKFLQLASYYLIFITWNGAFTLIRVEEKKRWIFGFVAFLVIYFAPSLVKDFVIFMQR